MTTQEMKDWIAARLPSAITFKKNGLTVTLDQMVTTALSQENGSKELALASLWDVIASDQLYDTFIDGDKTRAKALAQQKAEYWRSVAAAGGTKRGIANVPISFRNGCCGDEYSR